MAARCLGRISPCFSGIAERYKSKPNIETEQELEEYQRLVSFLGAVPLFKKQLPKDELPKVADNLKRMTWNEGEEVITQGEEGKAFFIILSGEASVVTENDDGDKIPLVTLYYMDYFGGHTLTSKRANIATISAKGPEPLVTLSMSRDRFLRLGMDKKLKFPRRPAIYDGRKVQDHRGIQRGMTISGASPSSAPKLNADEIKFVCNAVEHNANLRARTGNLHCEAVTEMAATAKKKCIKQGEEICHGGSAGQDFFIIAEGSFDVLANPLTQVHQGLEAKMANSTVTERLIRKQKFLVNMLKKGLSFQHHEEQNQSMGPLERQTSANKEGRGSRRPSSQDLKDPGDDAFHGTALKKSLGSWPAHTSLRDSGNKSHGATTDDVIRMSPKSRRCSAAADIVHAASSSRVQDSIDEDEDSPSRAALRRSKSMRAAPGTKAAQHLRASGAVIYEDDDSEAEDRFKIGDKVSRIVVGAEVTKENGEVIDIVEDSLITTTASSPLYLVEFADGKVEVRGSSLRPVEENAKIANLHQGDSYGELSLLYNTREVASCVACEDSVVYSISRRRFEECFRRAPPHFKQYCDLLDEVHILSPLLRAERAEMARKATGLFSFKPNEVVIRQGEVKPERLWYVIQKYDCILTKESDGTVLELGRLHRAAHFGERQIFKGDAASEFTVTAGREGMECLVIDGEILQNSNLDAEYILAGHTFASEAEYEVSQKLGNVVSNVDEYLKALPQTEEKFELNMDKLELNGLLGEGGFGSVLLASYEGKDYALKRLSKGWVVQSQVQLNVVAERDLLAMLNTPFIIQMHKSFRDDQWVYMLMEFCKGGHLLGVMEKHKDVLMRDKPRGSAAMFYTVCVSHALEYLHDKNIMYRDLKLENVLLDNEGYAKLCDMGFARFVHGKSNTQAGTPDYMAPEVIDPPHAHDTMVDWYALGVLCCELLSGQVPFDDQGLEDIQMCLEVIRSQQDRGLPKGSFGPNLALAEDFVRRCLTVDPKRRLGAKTDGQEIREHGWFADCKFNFQALLDRKMPAPYIAEKKIMEKKLGTSRTIKDHIKIDTDLFRTYDEDMVDPDHPDWDAAFDM